MFLFEDGGSEMALNFRLSGALYDIEDISAKLEILGADKGAKMQIFALEKEFSRNTDALKQVDAQRWNKLCDASGWTAYGAVALSWCQGATLPQVFDGWRASGFPLKPLPEYERPARFINPALLPRTRKLSELATAAEPDILALCAMIAHSPEPLEFDVSHPSLRGSPNPQIVAFLKSRMLQKPSRTQEEEDLIAAWSETVKGSEFDVWEGA